MSFQDIIGQAHAKQMLQNGLRNDKVSHAYLFAGPQGSGRKEMALTFAKALFCTEMKDDCCDECLECRKVDHHNHPDIHVIAPEGSSIKIEQIRALQREFAYRTGGGSRKVYIMEQADKMTVQAANSLLKFLEEPLSPVVAILLTENGQAMLPTIQSRAQWISFTPMDPKAMLQVLVQEGYAQSLARCAVHLASGLPACREIIQQNWFAEIRNVMLQLGKDCLNKVNTAMITAQQQLFKTPLAEHLDTLMSLFLLWFKDMIHYQLDRTESIIFIDQLESISKYAFSRTTEAWVRCMELTTEMQKRLRANVNPQLAFEQFLVGVQGG
ncbi:DNA polymerase III subunit delta' [Paenibacillus selenitireducens]|uniref:DNA polymerase III subunit delta n=1 Tax=Paenibacillus selenitireducens TaxID=1324314 RepID=A0A1T2WZZ8_9BACL|nr:DNA polymerase III subunit delta' [Paenibacillus selenitireducens]OPA73209.1 DNA polymerase III subunit delta' [Paenibacillus selenitireducens]